MVSTRSCSTGFAIVKIGVSDREGYFFCLEENSDVHLEKSMTSFSVLFVWLFLG
jgi:hypothetical protein